MEASPPNSTSARYGLWGAGILGTISMILVAGASITGSGKAPLRQSEPVASRSLAFVEREDRAIVVRDPQKNAVVAVVKPGRDGFVPVVVKAFSVKRKQQGIAPETPFQLIQWADGRLSIEDPLTNQAIRLDGFSSLNKKSFAKLMNAGSETR